MCEMYVTENHYWKYVIHRSIMYCFIYGESKLFILYMNIVYAFIIIDLISCVRFMETDISIIVNILYTGVWYIAPFTVKVSYEHCLCIYNNWSYVWDAWRQESIIVK